MAGAVCLVDAAPVALAGLRAAVDLVAGGLAGALLGVDFAANFAVPVALPALALVLLVGVRWLSASLVLADRAPLVDAVDLRDAPALASTVVAVGAAVEAAGAVDWLARLLRGVDVVEADFVADLAGVFLVGDF